MEKIITIYQGNDPRENERIKEVLKNTCINFYESSYHGLSLYLDPQETFFYRFKLLVLPGIWRSPFYDLCKKKEYYPAGFEIKILEKDEFSARKILNELKLSRPLCKKNPTGIDKFMNIFQKIALPVGVFFTLLVILFLISQLKSIIS